MSLRMFAVSDIKIQLEVRCGMCSKGGHWGRLGYFEKVGGLWILQLFEATFVLLSKELKQIATKLDELNRGSKNAEI